MTAELDGPGDLPAAEIDGSWSTDPDHPDRNERRGRRPLHDAEVERRMLLDAAMTVMRRNGFAETRVSAILEEAGLANRAFYRHFRSKDELLLGMVRRDMDYVERRIRARIADAAGPVEALEAFCDEHLQIVYDPRRRERVRVLVSDGAIRAEGYLPERRRFERALGAALADVIRTAVDTGEMQSDNPEGDALIVLSLCQNINRWGLQPETRKQAVALVMRFCGPALGLVPSKTAT